MCSQSGWMHLTATRAGLSQPRSRGEAAFVRRYLPGVWLSTPLSSPRSTILEKFWRSSLIILSGFETASATTSPTLPPGGSA